MALTDTFIKNVKPAGAAAGEKYTDGLGLHLLVKMSGKYWRMNYRFAKKQKTLALGVYPSVSLAKARQRREKAREQLADGIDPAEQIKFLEFACYGVDGGFSFTGASLQLMNMGQRMQGP